MRFFQTHNLTTKRRKPVKVTPHRPTSTSQDVGLGREPANRSMRVVLLLVLFLGEHHCSPRQKRTPIIAHAPCTKHAGGRSDSLHLDYRAGPASRTKSDPSLSQPHRSMADKILSAPVDWKKPLQAPAGAQRLGGGRAHGMHSLTPHHDMSLHVARHDCTKNRHAMK